MGAVGTLLERLLATAVIGGYAGVTRPQEARIPVVIAVTFGLVAALAFLVASCLWLGRVYGAQTAALIIGGASAGLCLLSVLAEKCIAQYKKTHDRLYQQEVLRRIENVSTAVLSEFEEPVRAYPKTAAALAVLAGFLIAGKLHDRTKDLARVLEKIND